MGTRLPPVGHHYNLTPPSIQEQTLQTLQRIEALLMVIADNTAPVSASVTPAQSKGRKNK